MLLGAFVQSILGGVGHAYFKTRWEEERGGSECLVLLGMFSQVLYLANSAFTIVVVILFRLWWALPVALLSLAGVKIGTWAVETCGGCCDLNQGEVHSEAASQQGPPVETNEMVI